jgi:hypothetical protein
MTLGHVRAFARICDMWDWVGMDSDHQRGTEGAVQVAGDLGPGSIGVLTQPLKPKLSVAKPYQPFQIVDTPNVQEPYSMLHLQPSPNKRTGH